MEPVTQPRHDGDTDRDVHVSISVVMPVYNEVAVIGGVIDEIRKFVLDEVAGSELIVVDDRSTDGTDAVLRGASAGDPRITVLHNDLNAGHGRSVRRGLDACRGDWIFHLDSDGQVDVSEFALLWERRHDADLVLGVRVVRHDPVHRLVLTRATRAVLSLLAKRPVRDANVPFKLVRRDLYEHLRPAIPPNTFAPSLMLVLGAYRVDARVIEVPTTHLPRMHGQSSLRLKRLAVAVLRSTVETLSFSRSSLTRYEHD
jgi:glycosyltransferase involved in cell wall biosynthesis